MNIIQKHHLIDYCNRHIYTVLYNICQTGNTNSTSCYTDFSGRHNTENPHGLLGWKLVEKLLDWSF